MYVLVINSVIVVEMAISLCFVGSLYKLLGFYLLVNADKFVWIPKYVVL